MTSDHDTDAVLSIFTHMCINTARPKPVVKVSPDQRVFRGETVTLTCDIQWTYSWFNDGETYYPYITTTTAENIQWTYSWFKDGETYYPYITTAAEYSFTAYMYHSGEYSCREGIPDTPISSDISAAVTLIVSGE